MSQELLSPDVSGSIPTPPNSSHGKGKSKGKLVQSILNFSTSSQSKTCKVCGMSYYQHISKEVEIHKKYHTNFINGIIWPESFTAKSLRSFVIPPKSKKHKTIQVQILTIDKTNKRQTTKIEQLLELVNKELNAPEDSKYWKDPLKESSKVFILKIEDRAVGICTTDEIEDIQKQGRWMIHRTQTIVPNQVNNSIRLGISRIWIAPKWRRLGLANALLDIVLNHSIYGDILKKYQIAFSQPSYSGGLLAKKFNGVIHKSGELLVPVYLEL
ncbi:N-acetyltransferase ECO1 [Scheffersomyces amazonensis]|uniref:N-acetyltransferase ECO1 n=1 Tax=Scheffersomyces amazonensis TaxID=1078765 RepID=UPI00315DD9D0